MTAISLLAPVASAATVVGPYRYEGELWTADPLPAPPKVEGGNAATSNRAVATPVPAGTRELRAHDAGGHASWPGASAASLTPGGGRTSWGPVTLAVPAAKPGAKGAAGARTLDASSSVRVELAARDRALAANVDGLLVSLSQRGSSDAGAVSVSVDYGAFADAHGGGWASRLYLVQMPACALTTPQYASCRTQSALETVNDPVTQKLTASVVVPAAEQAPAGSSSMRLDAQSGSGTVVAAVAGTGGSQGTYTATSLSASGSWGSSQGAFTYGYPVNVPPSLGGSAPSVGLSYNSQSVDGKTSAFNSQASWIGDGWDYTPGFIERSYKPCGKSGIPDSGDQCWAGWNATLSLGANSGQLVRDGNGVYHLQNDTGLKVERLTGASNGMWEGEYFKVSATDGTAYYFGLNHTPGTTVDAATNSAWAAPVYHPNPGDPCYTSASGKNSLCAAQPGYRFNLDFVVDANGNVQRYDWANETNYYNRGYGQVAALGDGGTLTAYTRGGYLTQISYGYKLADAAAGRDPAARVVFTTAQRCVVSDTVCQYQNLATGSGASWPDTPYDLNCNAGMATSGTGSNVCKIGAPTFWSTYRLKSITTKVKTATGWQDVDRYDLTHLFSDAGGTMDPVTGKTVDPTNAGKLQSVMWLSQIQRTGLDTSAGAGGQAPPLAPVTFTGIEVNNRVDGGPDAPPLYRPRISSIQTETGESIVVKYRDPECSRTRGVMPATADTNTKACYPVYWTTPGAKDPISDWFHKTLVEQISDNDQTKAASPARITRYEYTGGAAWHRDDSDLTDDKYRTWNDFRGYRTITTTTGAAPDPITQSTTSYLQGMDGDYKANGTRRTVSLTNSLGENTTDSNWLAGTAQEVASYTQAGGTITGKALATAPTMTDTATQARTAWTSATDPNAPPLSTLPPLTSRRVTAASQRSLGLLSNGTWRTTRTDTSYDSLGRPYQIDDKGDLSVPAQENCTTLSYANAPASNPMILVLPKETVTVAGPCSTAPGPNTTISGKRFFYDGDGTVTNPGTLGSIGSNGTGYGAPTATQALTSYDSSGNPVFQTTGAITYDTYGRVTKSRDAAGSLTTTTYTPATASLPTQVSTTNPLGWSASSSIAPARGLVTRAVDANGKITDSTYDSLGRRTQIWLPGRDKSAYPQGPDRKFSYAVNGAGNNPDPSSVTSQTLRENQTYSTSVSIYDGFLNARQTQTTTADNSAGRLIASTRYDSHGWAVSSTAPYADPSTAPGSTLFVEFENSLPSQTVTTYDGLGRSTASTLYSKASRLWASTTTYPGVERTDSTPPPGGTASTLLRDARGRTTSSIAHGGVGTGDVTTTYTYNPAGQLATTADTVGNTWTFAYDLLGRKTSQNDPDTGSSSITYDNLGRVAATTDARSRSISRTYDTLSRLTGTFDGTNTADAAKQLTSYSYDTLQKGYPTSTTRYVGGSGLSGSAYVQEVTGYNTAYQPTGTKITIPATEGKLAGTYNLGATYTPNVGLLAQSIYGADGNLPAETVGYGYNLQGGLVGSGSGRFTHYLDLANYSPLGQILQSTYGNAGVQVRTAQTYDDATGRLATNRVSLQSGANPVSDTTYGYDPSGNITTVSERQSSGAADLATDTQCFGYDGLDRLTTAWTDAQGITSPTAGQLATCTSTTPAPATIGGPASYWQTWQYNLLGDRTQHVKRDLTGNTAKDITQTLTYPGGGTTKANQPNTATTITTTGPTGTTTLTPQYDTAGNTKSRATTGATVTNQAFTYNAEGRTETVTTKNGTGPDQPTSYLYDADGGLLVQRGPTANVLYLFGGAEQLTLDKNTDTVSGIRHYANPDGTTIVRSSNGTLTYQPANPQNTAQLQIDATNLTITRRAFDPYGNPRGTTPSTWANNRGYLGQPTDTTTGLNLLGARNYDPTIGRFLTADPLFQPGDPNQMGGYAYASNNPTTSSDATGLKTETPDSSGGSGPMKPGSVADLGAGWAVGVVGAFESVEPWIMPVCWFSDSSCGGETEFLTSTFRNNGIDTESSRFKYGLESGHESAPLFLGPIGRAEGAAGGAAAAAEARAAASEAKVLAGRGGEIADEAAAASAARDLAESQAAKASIENAAREAEGATPKTNPASPEAPITPNAAAKHIGTSFRWGTAKNGLKGARTGSPRPVYVESSGGSRSLEERVGDASLLRNKLHGTSTGAARAATWTAAIRKSTGEIAVSCSGYGSCAEVNILEGTGWPLNDVIFIRAMRLENIKNGLGKVWQEKPICLTCQSIFTEGHFISGVLFEEGR
ncbi:RHS repeat domain-containing protein [Kitasatospora sp. NPDC001664]